MHAFMFSSLSTKPSVKLFSMTSWAVCSSSIASDLRFRNRRSWARRKANEAIGVAFRLTATVRHQKGAGLTKQSKDDQRQRDQEPFRRFSRAEYALRPRTGQASPNAEVLQAGKTSSEPKLHNAGRLYAAQRAALLQINRSAMPWWINNLPSRGRTRP